MRNTIRTLKIVFLCSIIRLLRGLSKVRLRIFAVMDYSNLRCYLCFL
jgi:hypothetical protein